jgi:hypothetical protein
MSNNNINKHPLQSRKPEAHSPHSPGTLLHSITTTIVHVQDALNYGHCRPHQLQQGRNQAAGLDRLHSTRIVAWGSTTGKLYLDDARLDDPKSRAGIWEYVFTRVGGEGTGDSGRDGCTEDVPGKR